MMTQTLGIPVAAGYMEHPTHGFNAELSLMFFDKDILILPTNSGHVTSLGCQIMIDSNAILQTIIFAKQDRLYETV
jgi:hypothetical protein